MTEEYRRGRRIENLRSKKGLSQLELATRMGYKSDSTISKWEKGSNIPTGKKLAMLAQILETTSDYILFGVEPDKEAIDLSDLRDKVVLFDGKPLSDDDVKRMQQIIKLSLGVTERDDNKWDCEKIQH